MKKIAIVCDTCGRTLIVNHENDATNMVRVNEADIAFQEKISISSPPRRQLNIANEHLCPICFAKEVLVWVYDVITLNPSSLQCDAVVSFEGNPCINAPERVLDALHALTKK